MRHLYFDESGNTGTNLLDSDQPVFVLAGLEVSDAGALPLLPTVKSGVFHFKNAWRTRANREAIAETLSAVVASRLARVHVVDKRYLAADLLMSVVIYRVLVRENQDPGVDGTAHEFVALFVEDLPKVIGYEPWRAVLRALLDNLRSPSPAKTDAFLDALREAHRLAVRNPLWSHLLDIAVKAGERQYGFLSSTTPGFRGWRGLIDPAPAAFLTLLKTWSGPSEKLVVHHDSSVTISAAEVELSRHWDPTKPRFSGFGAGILPIPVHGNISFQSSKRSLPIQLADMVASSVAQVVRSRLGMRHGEDVRLLEETGVLNLVVPQAADTYSWEKVLEYARWVRGEPDFNRNP